MIFTGVKSMKKQMVIAILCVVSLAVIVTGCSKKDDSKMSGEMSSADNTGISKKLQEVQKSGVLKVGSSGDVYAYIDQATGEFTGIDAEIIKEVAKRLGVKKVEMVLMPFSELILNLTSGNIDIICDGMYTRAERAKKIYYGDIWYTQGGSLVVQEDSPINSIADFDPKSTVVGYTSGTAWQSVVTGWEADKLIKQTIATGDQTDSLIALQYDKIDAFLTDSTAIESLQNNSPATLKGLRLCTEYKDSSETLGHIAPSVTFENIDFMHEINKVVYQLREEGFIEESMVKCGLIPSLHMITNSEEDRDPQVNSK
jgi:polar amino acid transport system substrate-binding protein